MNNFILNALLTINLNSVFETQTFHLKRQKGFETLK